MTKQREIGYLFTIPLVLLVISCSKGTDTEVQEDDTSVSVTPQSTVPPPPTSPPSTPAATGQFQSIPQNGQYSQYAGWPYYNYNQSAGWQQAYPSGYQTSQYYYPNFNPWRRGFRIAGIVDFYRRYLGRNPDEWGVHFWLREIIAGRPRNKIIEDFITQSASLGNSIHVQNVIALFRVNLGMLPHPGALQAWVTQLSATPPTTTLPTIASQFGFGGYYTTSITDLYKATYGRFPTSAEYNTNITAVRGGTKAFVDLATELRNAAEATTIGKLVAENCILVHRIITGYLPPAGELAACVAKGDNTTPNSGNYNTLLQTYAQELMNRNQFY